MKKTVRCPGCQGILDVSNPKGEQTRICVCPNCGKQFRVDFPPVEKAVTVDPSTVYVKSTGGRQDPSTEYGPPKGDGAKQVYLVDDTTHRRYPLQQGDNVVGRQSSTSKATVPLLTNDTYISRQHCVISVMPMPGQQAKLTLRNAKNLNPTLVEGKTVRANDIIVLKPATKIQMGDTFFHIEKE